MKEKEISEREEVAEEEKKKEIVEKVLVKFEGEEGEPLAGKL